MKEISDLQQLKQQIENNEFAHDKLKELDEKIQAKSMLLKEIDLMKYNLFIMNKSEFDIIFKDLDKLKNIKSKSGNLYLKFILLIKQTYAFFGRE